MVDGISSCLQILTISLRTCAVLLLFMSRSLRNQQRLASVFTTSTFVRSLGLAIVAPLLLIPLSTTLTSSQHSLSSFIANSSKFNMPRKSFRSATLNTPTTSAAPKHDAVPQIPSTFTDGLPLPKLFVFDLDYTLWPFWVDTHVSGSLKPTNKDPSLLNTAMTDGYGETFTFYKEVPGILHAARQKGITMGLASRTSAPDLAGVMLRGIIIPTPTTTSSSTTVDEGSEPDKSSQSGKEKETPLKAWDYFAYKEIYPGSKIRHFESIQNKTRKHREGGELAFADMLFFDDESRNREVETKLGVTFVLVRDGVTKAEVDRGVWDWRRRRGLDKSAGQGKSEEDSE